MTPLRWIEINRDALPEPPKRGTVMELDRTLVIAMLDLQQKYYPIEIARIAYAYELQSGKFVENHDLILNTRRAYSELTIKAGRGSNVALSGADWLGLVGAALHSFADLMDELKLAMAKNPGVVYTYHEGELMPYPDQSASTAPFRPPQLVVPRRTQVIFTTIEQEPEPTGSNPAESEASPAEREAECIPAPQMSPAQASQGETDTMELARTGPEDGISPSLDKESRPPQAEKGMLPLARVSRRGLLVASLILVFLVPGVAALYIYQLDQVGLADIQEMGAPSGESPYFLAHGRRYEEGDRLRFEGEVGVIKQIRRDHLVVGEQIFLAPALNFFGREMAIEGNLVVYPGSPHPVTGNFWVSDSSALDELQAGYLSWYGGYKNYEFASGEVCEHFAFWAEITGKALNCNSTFRIAIPADIQWEEFVEQCLAEGATIQQLDNYLEVTWP